MFLMANGRSIGEIAEDLGLPVSFSALSPNETYAFPLPLDADPSTAEIDPWTPSLTKPQINEEFATGQVMIDHLRETTCYLSLGAKIMICDDVGRPPIAEVCSSGAEPLDEDCDGQVDESSVCSCGDGEINEGELCDDGGLTEGDGCDATCQPERCGNGLTQTTEECDDGNLTAGDGCDELVDSNSVVMG